MQGVTPEGEQQGGIGPAR